MRLLPSLLLATLTLLGQEAQPFEAIQKALSLSDAQLKQLQQTHQATLNDAQKAGLNAIAKVLTRAKTAASAIELSLIEEKLWPGETLLCYLQDVRAKSPDASELGIPAALAKSIQEKVEAANNPLHGQVSEIPPREIAFELLDEAQQAKLAAFEYDLSLASEAIQLGLLSRPLRGEPLCN